MSFFNLNLLVSEVALDLRPVELGIAQVKSR